MNNGFNIFKVNDSTHVQNADSSRNVKKLTNAFKYKYEILSCVCFNIY